MIKNNIIRDYKLKNAWLKNEYKKSLVDVNKFIYQNIILNYSGISKKL